MTEETQALHRVVPTEDGSLTLESAAGVRHRSIHGAQAESLHVFIAAGLAHRGNEGGAPLRVLELGVGTGRNALNAAAWAQMHSTELLYVGLEPYPAPLEALQQIDFEEGAAPFLQDIAALHADSPWLQGTLHPHFRYHLLNSLFEDFESQNGFDVLFFDPFADAGSAHLWQPGLLSKAYSLLNAGGVFVTYACTGQLKRSFAELGAVVERLPGAPGKREMFRATKPR